MCALYVEGKAEQRVTKLRLLTQCECAGTLKDECGLPFACVVQPFARVEEAPLSKPAIVRAQDIGRCRQCYACVQPSLLTVSCVSCAHASRHTCMCQPVSALQVCQQVLQLPDDGVGLLPVRHLQRVPGAEQQTVRRASRRAQPPSCGRLL